MATALGSILGPLGGILGGLLGYVAATGSDYEDDLSGTTHEPEEEALYLLELRALQIAAELTEPAVNREIWDEICEEVCDEIDRISDCSDQPYSLSSATGLMVELVSESISRVDHEAYLEFATLFEAVLKNPDCLDAG